MTTTTIETGSADSLKQIFNSSIAYILLTLSILPILLGYAWLVIATLSIRTEGILPKDAEGNIGGWTWRTGVSSAIR